MSTPFPMFRSLPSTYMPELQRQVWGRLFGHGIEECRIQAGLSVADAARLAGMATPEWAAIEEGHVPGDTDRLHAMADAMAIDYDKLLNLVALCKAAWEL
jgi:transcriptional regulator with XRE-family HTH domain